MKIYNLSFRCLDCNTMEKRRIEVPDYCKRIFVGCYNCGKSVCSIVGEWNSWNYNYDLPDHPRFRFSLIRDWQW